MSEKPKRKPKEFGKASVDFVAPLSLADCVLRIRDMKSLPTGFMKPGFDPSYEKAERGIYSFKIKCTHYDSRSHQEISNVTLEGYLQKIDVASTIVVAKTHVSIMAKIGMGVMAIFVWPISLLYLGTIWADNRALTTLIHRVMSDDLL